MTMHLECVIAEQLSDSIVSLHYLSLRLLIAAYNHYGRILSEHHLEIVLRLLMTTAASTTLVLIL